MTEKEDGIGEGGFQDDKLKVHVPKWESDDVPLTALNRRYQEVVGTQNVGLDAKHKDISKAVDVAFGKAQPEVATPKGSPRAAELKAAAKKGK